ncbi:MAG TPA: hypothetical protein VGS58_14760 [Candidatus Sulfopaludibacter sp.]|nr:hypothetical protein [Candidatus Sulfopaludibacter sp.]
MESDTGAVVIVTAAGRRPLPGAASGAVPIVISPQGSAAAIYTSDTGAIQIFSGLPAAPQLVRQVSVEAPPLAFAISDDATRLLTVAKAGLPAETILSYTGAQPPQTLGHASGVKSIQFVPGSGDALLSTAETVLLASTAYGVRTIGDTRIGLGGVTAVGAFPGGSPILIGTRSGQVILRDLDAGSQTVLTCACVPTAFAPLRGSGIFRLTETGAGPLWLLDAASAEPRILFVAGHGGGSQ